MLMNVDVPHAYNGVVQYDRLYAMELVFRRARKGVLKKKYVHQLLLHHAS
jgi:hypothetical protein